MMAFRSLTRTHCSINLLLYLICSQFLSVCIGSATALKSNGSSNNHFDNSKENNQNNSTYDKTKTTKNDKMRILVTGGAGFIGSHLAESLLIEGHTVIILDNFTTGSSMNLLELHQNPNLVLIEHDVKKPINLRVDQIYHLASPASPSQYMKDPIETIQTNYLGTRNMLELASKYKAKFLLASTSEVYGDPEKHPQKESYWGNVNPIGPRACYDESKRLCEALAIAYRSRNVSISIARIFNTYGPRMQLEDGRVVSNFIVRALGNETLNVYGDGSQTRSFLYISDLVAGLKALMNSSEELPVNIGYEEDITIKKLIETIDNLIPEIKLRINNVEPLIDDPKQRRPDLTKAFRVLNGWKPETQLKDGLRKTIDYFNEILHTTD